MKLIVFLIFSLNIAYSQDFGFSISGIKKPRIIKNYYQKLKKFRKKTCYNQLENDYQKLFKSYKGNGFYTPFIDESIDRDTIKKNIHLLYKKKKWISAKITRLNKYIRLPKLDSSIEKVEKLMEESLELKHQFDVENKRDQKIITAGKKNYRQLRNAFKKLEDKIFYLQNFSYPVDHMRNRLAHTMSKRSKNKKDENMIFFVRKVYEDGAPSPSRHGDDAFYRTAFDTIRVELNKKEVFIGDNLRYDLEWFLKLLPKLRKKGLKFYKAALNGWQKEINESLRYYEQISKNNIKDRKFASSKLDATKDIKKFVAVKSAEAYRYWSKESDIYQALFAIDTILFNEVGAIDPSGLERKEVIKVVLNRYLDPAYANLKTKQDLKEELKGIKTPDFKWLNVLFSEGEFSFTYYFLPAVTNIYCPSFSKWGKKLRAQNLKLASQVLSEYDESEARAMRYFSRASMLGRIDMTSIWKNYVALPEQLGESVKITKALTQSVHKKDYRYLYSFSRKEKTYRVLEIEGNKLVFEPSEKVFYRYRDPHLFRYFSPRKPRTPSSTNAL